ncbi:MAG: 2,3-bisphosphoglycerate-independent phosphoglycerate mutase [Puniceicoccales bacterium]|jgi:2,3-bisphosphoglycerate-independent phosphoglycerate mutase|nr:2,3-bisphosphoglycerate-independent phosphoglycerate mutase [Puniceicoccales bacterium]
MGKLRTGRAVLVIRDGWGICSDEKLFPWDGTREVATPHTDRLRRDWPRVEISASGLDVGLPAGTMGNSEVGHQNIGAGRVVDQEIVRISRALADGSLAENSALQAVFGHVRRNRSRLHLLGLLSDGGVHSVLAHPMGLLRLARDAGIETVYLHAFLDGRDSPPRSGLGYVRRWEEESRALGTGKIATLTGRFWAMDRDRRWERVEKAYRCLVGDGGERETSPEEALARRHGREGKEGDDEFFPPTRIVEEDGSFPGAIGDGDGVIFFNFRGDRPREIIRAFLDGDFEQFPRDRRLHLCFATLTDYEKDLCPLVLFPRPAPLVHTLGAYLSSLGLRQFRTAETEKYAHVTFFFNDYREEPYPGEERRLIPSPRDVATYDLRPEMSARAVCDALVTAMRSRDYNFLVANFANPDMVGHTGNLSAARRAVAAVDACLGEIFSAADASATRLLIAADHGNVEEMWDPANGVPHTQHTANPVEASLYGDGLRGKRLREGGRLADIAPTVLELMGLAQPEEMTGKSLLIPGQTL